MSDTVDQAFIKEFDDNVTVAYQRSGAKLRGFVREKNPVKGNEVRFQKYGTGAMGTKARHGLVPTINADHSYVDVTLADYYGGEYIDDLDEIKTNIDERNLAASALSMAAGRKVDERIINAATVASLDAKNVIAHGGISFTKAKVLQMGERFAELDIPDDGQRVVAISPDAWMNGLMGITEFTNQDYVGPDQLPWTQGATAKRWMGFFWMMHSGLSLSSTTRTCLAWHKPAVGIGMGKEITANFDWIPEKASYFAQARVSCEGVVIQADGLMRINVTET